MTDKTLKEEIRDIRTEAEQIDRNHGGGDTRDERAHIKMGRAGIGNASADMLDELRRENERLKARLTEAGHDVTQTLIQDQARLENEIRAHPLQSILIAGLAGFVAANLLARPGRY